MWTLHIATFSEDTLVIFMLWFVLEFWWWNINIYLFFCVYSRLTSLWASITASLFFFMVFMLPPNRFISSAYTAADVSYSISVQPGFPGPSLDSSFHLITFFDVSKFTTLTWVSLLILCELLFPVVGLKISSLPTSGLKPPNKMFECYHTSHKDQLAFIMFFRTGSHKTYNSW
jgi:hypothetical protein